MYKRGRRGFTHLYVRRWCSKGTECTGKTVPLDVPSRGRRLLERAFAVRVFGHALPNTIIPLSNSVDWGTWVSNVTLGTSGPSSHEARDARQPESHLRGARTSLLSGAWTGMSTYGPIPSCYHLFGIMKIFLPRRQFVVNHELQGCFQAGVLCPSKMWFLQGMKRPPQRWCKCIRLQREYAERVGISSDL